MSLDRLHHTIPSFNETPLKKRTFEKVVEKGEIADDQHFPTVFQYESKSVMFDSLSLDQSGILIGLSVFCWVGHSIGWSVSSWVGHSFSQIVMFVGHLDGQSVCLIDGLTDCLTG